MQSNLSRSTRDPSIFSSQAFDVWYFLKLIVWQCGEIYRSRTRSGSNLYRASFRRPELRSYGVYSVNASKRKNGNGSLKREQPNVRAPFKSASSHRHALHCKWHRHGAASNRKRDVSLHLKVRRVKICVVTRNFSLSRSDICIADVAGQKVSAAFRCRHKEVDYKSNRSFVNI